MGVQLVISTSNRYQTMGTNTINLIHIIHLPILVLPLLRLSRYLRWRSSLVDPHLTRPSYSALHLSVPIAETQIGMSSTLSLPSSSGCRTRCQCHSFPSQPSIPTALSIRRARHRCTQQSLSCSRCHRSRHSWQHWRLCRSKSGRWWVSLLLRGL
ncbi:hypothetical protein HYC85_016825 [Camellia sinensis]|uniref:Uncharacterized protein n=1 Tax=Camellia sinensis TaxID=4442 RepID=A0A7J7H1Y6_CAMSI|nr:hypothetical protein HYC85_016825 [Camellia sinensis]